jgi:hypothetical protein
MAIFPQGLTQVDQRCNVGERRTLHQLKRCLGDDYLVWHNVPIGPRARQPDFVVLSPRQGVLLLEVKDWKPSTLVGANRDSVELATPRGRVTEANPLRQARDYAFELVDLMQRDPALTHADGPFRGKLLFPYGWGVVFSHQTRADWAGTDFHQVFTQRQLLMRDDLEDSVSPDDFFDRLWGLFTVHYPHTLTLPQRDRIRWHLFPEIRLQQQSALAFEDEDAAAPRLPDLMEVMDLQQEQMARTLGDGHRVIHGVAGSGKTMILIYRAQQLAAAASPDQPILVLCFNRTLADRIEAQLRLRGVDERVQVRTFHAWCQDMVRSYQLHVADAPDPETRFRLLADTVERSMETGFIPGGQYTALLIDEAHDFEESWLRLATRMVNPSTRSLLVLYDDAQSIYQKKRRHFTFASVGIQAQGRTGILRLNYRNTAEVLALATLCARSLLLRDEAAVDGGESMPLVQPASAGRRGPLPVLISARDAREEADLLAERIEALLGEQVPAGDIAVLFRAKYLMAPLEQALRRRRIAFDSMNERAFRRFDWTRATIRLLTMHSAKGLEFAHVFVAGLQALPMRDESLEDALRLLYVAMTRSTSRLVLAGSGYSPITARVKDSIARVRASFAVDHAVL